MKTFYCPFCKEEVERPHKCPKMKDIKFEKAASDEIDFLDNLDPDLVDEFILKIFDTEGAMLTDMSSAWDFKCIFDDQSNDDYEEEIVALVQKEYGVDVSDVEDLLIYGMLRKIKENT